METLLLIDHGITKCVVKLHYGNLEEFFLNYKEIFRGIVGIGRRMVQNSKRKIKSSERYTSKGNFHISHPKEFPLYL